MRTRPLGTRRAGTALTALSAAVVGVTGLTITTTGPALAAASCESAYPVDSLTAGQAITGLTTSQGTTPEAFSGEIIGVLEDGIAPGVDLIIADLTSPAIDKNGFWQGMSGSPVYAADGRLIGSTSYGLNEGKSTIAGITPTAALQSVDADEADQTVRLSRRMAARAVASGGATRAQASSGLKPLPTPIQVSGLTARRFDQLEGWLDDHGPVTRGAAAAAFAPDAEESDLVPGGNVAASLGYGFVSAVATGTVTTRCDDEVVAFGHPFNYAGESTYSLHPASVAAVVPGGTFAGYKLANPGAPVGIVDRDRLGGIRGTVGTLPETWPVTSTASYRSREVAGTTQVSVADLVADAGLANAFAVSDRALDRSGKGGAQASWTITGERLDGTPFSLAYSDIYASSSDVASAPLTRLAIQLEALLSNETEAVTITGITTDTKLSDDATTWRIGRTYQKVGSTTRRITRSAPAVLKAGKTIEVLVEIYSRTQPTPVLVPVPVTAGRKSAGRTGVLTVTGGSQGEDEEFFFDDSDIFFDEYEDEILGGDIGETIPETLKRLAAEPKNDALASTFTVRGTTTKKQTQSLGKVVSGRVVVPVRVTR